MDIYVPLYRCDGGQPYSERKHPHYTSSHIYYTHTQIHSIPFTFRASTRRRLGVVCLCGLWRTVYEHIYAQECDVFAFTHITITIWIPTPFSSICYQPLSPLFTQPHRTPLLCTTHTIRFPCSTIPIWYTICSMYVVMTTIYIYTYLDESGWVQRVVL